MRERPHSAAARLRTWPCVATVLCGSSLSSRLGTFSVLHVRERSNPCDHGRWRCPTHRLGGAQRAGGVVQVLGVSEPPGIGGHRIVRFHGGRRGVNS